MSSTNVTDITWPADRLLPIFQAPEQLDTYDIRKASKEVQLSAATMAGLINHPRPRVYLISSDDDPFWLKEVLASIPQKTSPATGEDILDALLTSYRGSVQGMIIYNPDFPDSINIATTLAGQCDGVVVSPLQAQALHQGTHQLPVLEDFRNYSWRNRLQAYSWAKDHLFSNASHHLVAGLSPTIPAGLRSFLVASRAFIYWLDSRSFIPNPMAGWISERGLMKQIYADLLPGAVHLGWFIDEGTGVSLTSRAAIPVLATDYFFNLEVWTSVPQEFRNGAANTREERPYADTRPSTKVYVSFTMSDGDNLQYVQHRMERLWQDTARGSVPIGWTISSLLTEAAPKMAAYYMHGATPNDELLAGPCGAGYMFPSQWPQERLPGFLQRTGQLMQRMNLSIVEVLDMTFLQSLANLGPKFLVWLFAPGMTFTGRALQELFVQGLVPFGIRGLLSGSGLRNARLPAVVSGVPVYQNLGLADSVSKTVSLIQKAASRSSQRPLFLNVYVFAFKVSPTDLKQVVEQFGDEYEIVTPGTLLAYASDSYKDQL